ncbi:hypothetical protein ACVFI8_05390 [Agarivorans sp. MS3-6]
MSTSSTFFIGLDVHKETTDVAYCVDNSRDVPIYHGTIPTNIRSINKLIKKYKGLASHLCVVYDAGLFTLGCCCCNTYRDPNRQQRDATRPCPCCQHPMHCTGISRTS